jgi:hypothetical protein
LRDGIRRLIEWFAFGRFELLRKLGRNGAVLHHLYEVLEFKCLHLRWVPELLTDDLRQKRKDIAREMIPYLEAAFQDGW